jgi:hypothetical protein
MGVTYGFELRGKVDEAHLKQAWKLVQDEFPYARTVLRIAVGEACFVEEPQVCPSPCRFSSRKPCGRAHSVLLVVPPSRQLRPEQSLQPDLL